MTEQEPWDELMGPPRKNQQAEEDPTLSETSQSSATSSIRMPSRWAQYERDSEQLQNESHEANSKAVEMAAEKIANTPPRYGSAPRTAARRSNSYESESGDESEEEPENNEAAIRLEALKMLELADDHLSNPYSVRKTQSGGFSASYSGGFGAMGGSGHSSRSGSRRSSTSSSGRHVPKALAGLDFSKRASSIRASYTSSPRASYDDGDNEANTEQENLVDVIEMEERPSTIKNQRKWSSRYSIDHTLLALSGGRTRNGNVKDVLTHMERESDREIKSARNMYISSPHENEKPRIFGAGGFSFRDNPVFGSIRSKYDAEQTAPINKSTNLKTAWVDVYSSGLDSNGKSLTPPEPRKTWQEQERKRKQQRRLALVSAGLCFAIAILIGIMASRGGGDTGNSSAFGATGTDRGVPEVTFYVTSDSPYDSAEEQKLSADLQAISDGKFIVHLGNIQNSAVTLCSESRYSRVKDILMQSPVPMFILPGEEDWNNCPNPENAWETWQDTFDTFEANFDHSFVVSRQMRRKENFSFLYQDVLFIGFHLVGGRVNDREELNQRMEDNIEWMEAVVAMSQENFKSIVMMGNARPGPQQRQFFDRLADFLGPFDLPSIYIHANAGVGGIMQYDIFGGDYGIEGLQIEDGGQNPPLKISVYQGDGPFVVG